MAYRTQISQSKLNVKLPQGLLNHISGPEYPEKIVNYSYPKVEPFPGRQKRRNPKAPKYHSVRLPARINNPLEPYTKSVLDYITFRDKGAGESLHDHHYYQLTDLDKTLDIIPISKDIKSKSKTFQINDLREMIKFPYTQRTELIHLASIAFAKRAVEHELSTIAMAKFDYEQSHISQSPFLSFVICIHKLRMLLSRIEQKNSKSKETILENCYEPNLIHYNDGTYCYYAQNEKFTFYLIGSGGHFRLYHSCLDSWFCGSGVYLDYMFTCGDILNNLNIITQMDEYVWASTFLHIFVDVAQMKGNHNSIVEFMKNLEGFLLNLSDYDENYAMNWQPMMDSLYNLWKLDQVITGSEYEFILLPALIHDKNIFIKNKTLLIKIILAAHDLTRTQLQEMSSIHKLIFYAEVESERGVEKFLKRVHTPRKINPDSIKNLTRLAKQIMFTSYMNKHKFAPNMLGDSQKIELLRLYQGKNDSKSIKQLPLQWWDDIELYNCMDNTLTDDALEFAKDKGALKKENYIGPGDSRKELLQLIESPDYKLKNFFEENKCIPKIPKVYKCKQMAEPTGFQHPVRLIPKEREQKFEGRLYANGELSDKHALSVIATKMKKVLSYFDEQFMTPADKIRKELLHQSAQELRYDDKFSLLLDIEGHNQSMQYSNTSELSQFCGMLFGETEWGNLPNYFSSIDVFFYNEYDNEAILSNGQLGGIEGWLNPFWTLHTTLMMKLLRYMTDIEIPQIMVYSDDVDAIIQIKQASESTVQSTFTKIIDHCYKFGMIVKFSQTTLSKHRATILRQHYADGYRADSTIKKLISTSGANNPVIFSEEIEIAGICSSISSAMELTNHSITCCFLKNYKISLLLSRLPHMILSRPAEEGPLSPQSLPGKLPHLLYHMKDDYNYLMTTNINLLIQNMKNDIGNYLMMDKKNLNESYLKETIKEYYGESVLQYKYVDSADRLLYLQLYDTFLQDLLFFWIYLPASLGGTGGILQINLMLSGHSSGFSKSIFYLKEWIDHYSGYPDYFRNYLEIVLSIDENKSINNKESRILSSYWPNDMTITTSTTSIQQSIKSFIKKKTRNKEILKLIKLEDESENLMNDMIELFRDNFHIRMVQFYYENTSVHFLDFLVRKIETSSSFLNSLTNLARLRNSLCFRTIENIRLGARSNRTTYGEISADTDIIQYLLQRRCKMFSRIKFIEVEELLYDDKLEESSIGMSLLTVRRCSPQHYQDGVKIYDKPDMGNEIRYKGELLDDDRMLGNKEELLAAKLTAVTKWILTKTMKTDIKDLKDVQLDCVAACNLSLSTLTGQTLQELWMFSPNETGGEILHRIPNMRFSTKSYIRSEMNLALNYTVDINQRICNLLSLVDSNINFDYLRLRILLSAMVRSKSSRLGGLVRRYNLKKMTGIEDVQHVIPLPTKYTIQNKYTNYSLFRGHKISQSRFRYLAAGYLYCENLYDLALIPNELELNTTQKVGHRLIQDLIVEYSRHIDREHMSINPIYIDLRLWNPLLAKLEKLDFSLQSMTEDDKLNYLAVNLESGLIDRKMITVVNKRDKLLLQLQNQCIDYIREFKPKMKEYEDVIRRCLALSTSGRINQSLSRRLAQFQNRLTEYGDIKARLGIALICEQVLFFHFHVTVSDSSIKFDYWTAHRNAIEEDLWRVSLTLLNPELQIQAQLLGIEYLNSLIRSNKEEILTILEDISENNELADIIVPGNLPNLKPITTLTGSELIIQSSSSIDYSLNPISYTSMMTLDRLEPLCKFAQKCSLSGSDPRIFESPTGSDSFIPQLALFQTIKNRWEIDYGTSICDLTGGRGDFRYVSNYLGLNSITYSKLDTFTSIFHHPDVIFHTDYDIRKNESLKFILSFDWVHIDISFTGNEDLNILDLILLLESNNIAYSIRLNSVVLRGYTFSILESIPKYDHYLSYPTNRNSKPYQIYLIGVPENEINVEEGIPLNKTEAFRAMALSYGHLLNSSNYSFRNYEDFINSATIYLPNNEDLINLFTTIINRNLMEQKHYYSERFISELIPDDRIIWLDDCIVKEDQQYLQIILDNQKVTKTNDIISLEEEEIGNVSNESKPFHVSHITGLKDPNIIKSALLYTESPPLFLEYMRIHHPTASARSKCNIVLGLYTFGREWLLQGRQAITKGLRDSLNERLIKDTLHQREYQNAIKLLMLSASEDNYTYGIRYCHYMMQKSKTMRESYLRTLKIYRLISFHFDRMKEMIHRGKITIGHIRALRHFFRDREMQKQKYKPLDRTRIIDYLMSNQTRDVIEDSIDLLFDQIEGYVNSMVNQETQNNSGFDFSPTGDHIQLNLDIGIDDIINSRLELLNLNVPNEYGIIDIGDDYEEED